MPDPEVTTRAYADALTRMRDLAHDVRPEEFGAETGCPGWTVQDLFAHVAGIEHVVAGDPPAEHVVDPLPAHVGSDFAAGVEVEVDYRRAWAPADVVADLDGIVARRVDWLATVTPEDFERDWDGPFGPTSLGGFFPIRAIDVFMHEQDVRRATGRLAAGDSPAVAFCIDFVLRRWARLVPEAASEVSGHRIGVVVDGRRRTLDYTGERGTVLTDDPFPTDVELSFDVAGLMAYGGGRAGLPQVAWSGQAPDADALAKALLANAGFTP